MRVREAKRDRQIVYTFRFARLLSSNCIMGAKLIFSVSRSFFGWTRTETVFVSKKGWGGFSKGFGLKSVGSESFGFGKFGFGQF